MTVTILFIISILFSRVTVNVLVFVLRVVFFHLTVYIVTRYMYDAVRRDFALSASFVLECSDGSEVTTREGNELLVRKENCVVEEINRGVARGGFQGFWTSPPPLSRQGTPSPIFNSDFIPARV